MINLHLQLPKVKFYFILFYSDSSVRDFLKLEWEFSLWNFYGFKLVFCNDYSRVLLKIKNMRLIGNSIHF